jgi:hypothetical protein
MSDPEVFIGLDVGKSEHHCVAMNVAGERLVDRPLPNDEQALRALLGQLARHGLPVVVDQPASIGTLPVAVAQDMGLDTGYLPGLAMRRIADLHIGEAKTDARDAFVIADAARTLPHTLRSVDIAGPAMADLAVPGPGSPPIRLLHQRRTPRPGREQTPEERAVPLRVRRAIRPRQETQHRLDLPSPPPHRRHLRHAARPNPLPTEDNHCGLTNPIGRTPRSG